MVNRGTESIRRDQGGHNESASFKAAGFQKAFRVIYGLITDHFSKWAEIIPLKKASAGVIADNFFDNYISRFGDPIKLISDNSPQFISDIFEHLSERLGIRHVKTVVYRPQAKRTKRVNRDLVQIIANYVNDQHDTWDQFLREFAYAIRTAVNETTKKNHAELFLGRKLITPFQKLVMVSDGPDFIPTQLACAYLTSHLTGRALYWFDVLGYKVVEEKATDYTKLKHALAEQFPVVRYRLELETCFYASYQNQNQRPSGFVYELLKIHKNLKLEMAEEKLLDHIISHLELQPLDYVEVRHPQTTSSLLQLIDKYEERFLNKMTKGSSHDFRNTNHSANNRFTNRKTQENWWDIRVETRYQDTSRPHREFNRFGGQGVGDNRRFDS
ncbi:uncharacterized protein TNCV_309831 [Trichonephila clavipes]|nr:uncharacterized protein TNCV_309831 [Trichonephila clavipes]